MSKSLFVTATGTDVGKTYITALLIKCIRDMNLNCAYYKAANSGAENIASSDGGYVNKIASINQDEHTLVSYCYKTPASPHLAANIENNQISIDKIISDYKYLCSKYDYLVVEGSGGIICPIRWDSEKHILLEDIIKTLSLSTLVVADAGLGTINSTALTISYLKQKDITVNGIILNKYDNKDIIHKDNFKMIEDITKIPIIATVKENDTNLVLTKEQINNIFN